MPKTMTPAPPDVLQVLRQAVERWHPDLLEADVTWAVLMVYAAEGREGKLRGPALKLHGTPALAIVKLNSLEDRVKGLPDLTLKIDGDQWPDHTEERQLAIMDHEAEHVVVVRDGDGAVVSDDAGRPKLKLRPHDLELGGFSVVMERHGMQAVESQTYRDIHQRVTQMTFPWG